MNSRIPPGSIALVTGSSSGFGLLSCVELARRGLHVVASMRDLDRSEELDQAMSQAGASYDKVRIDVDDPASIDAALDEVRQRHTPNAPGIPIDVLVNNAGFGLGGFIEDVSMAELREQMETNFFGLVAMTKAVLPSMRERRRGRIINISSISGRAAQPGMGAYAASKFAVEGISESLRHELLPHGVFVVLVEPGIYRTEIYQRNRRLAEATLDPASPNYETSQRMLGLVEERLARSTADPAEVARTVAAVATAERPRLRYLVGKDATVVGTLKSVVPFSLWERALGRMTGTD